MTAESPLTIEQVDLEMDRLIAPDIDSASLYRRWERQQWAVSDLDFSQDKADWLSLPEGVRQVTQNTMTSPDPRSPRHTTESYPPGGA